MSWNETYGDSGFDGRINFVYELGGTVHGIEIVDTIRDRYSEIPLREAVVQVDRKLLRIMEKKGTRYCSEYGDGAHTELYCEVCEVDSL